MHRRRGIRSMRMRFSKRCLLLMLLGLGSVTSIAMAQRAFDPLAPSEIEQAKEIFLSDVRVKQNLGESARYRIVNVERHEEAKGVASSGLRRADVVLYDYTQDLTISALVRLTGNAQVDDLRIATGESPALSPEEVEEARRLALATPEVRATLESLGVSDQSRESLAITHLFARAMDSEDLCSTHRCLAFFFNTKEAYLFTAVVDLSAQRVQVQ